MISLKKYLELEATPAASADSEDELRSELIVAYRSALRTMSTSSLEACPAMGGRLMRGLGLVEDSIAGKLTASTIRKASRDVHTHLTDWEKATAGHYRQKTDEVKHMLTIMAHAAEDAGRRDERSAGRFTDVTRRLGEIGSLDDLAQIRLSIEASAADLRASTEQMTADNQAAMNVLRAELNDYQARLAEASQQAMSDSLTGLRNRLWMENAITEHIDAGASFCILLVDLDKFKIVNDQHGHLAGDDLLQQFSSELKLAFRSGDAVARWGGDEFLVLLPGDASEAKARTLRIKQWACGDYKLNGTSGLVKLHIQASVGFAEHSAPETMKSLLGRADVDMYRDKASARAAR